MKYKIYLCDPCKNIDRYHFLRFNTIKNTGFYFDISYDFINNCNTNFAWDIKHVKETDFNNFVFSYNSKEEAIKQYNQFKETYPELFI